MQTGSTKCAKNWKINKFFETEKMAEKNTNFNKYTSGWIYQSSISHKVIVYASEYKFDSNLSFIIIR